MMGGHEWWKYVYDNDYDCVICPEYQPLRYDDEPGDTGNTKVTPGFASAA